MKAATCSGDGTMDGDGRRGGSKDIESPGGIAGGLAPALIMTYLLFLLLRKYQMSNVMSASRGSSDILADVAEDLV
jgi:hypothetical protein